MHRPIEFADCQHFGGFLRSSSMRGQVSNPTGQARLQVHADLLPKLYRSINQISNRTAIVKRSD
jgi:hypothetical protein